MREQDRRPDFFEQCHNGVAIQGLNQSEIRDAGELRSVKLVESRVAHLPSSGPLRVKVRLRPKVVAFRRRKPLLYPIQIQLRHRSVEVCLVRSLTPPYLINHIDSIAVSQKILRPAFASVRSLRKVRPRL